MKLLPIHTPSIACAAAAARVLSGVHAPPLVVMQSTGVWDQIGAENIFVNIDDALNRARQILNLPPLPTTTAKI